MILFRCFTCFIQHLDYLFFCDRKVLLTDTVFTALVWAHTKRFTQINVVHLLNSRFKNKYRPQRLMKMNPKSKIKSLRFLIWPEIAFV